MLLTNLLSLTYATERVNPNKVRHLPTNFSDHLKIWLKAKKRSLILQQQTGKSTSECDHRSALGTAYNHIELPSPIILGLDELLPLRLKTFHLVKIFEQNGEQVTFQAKPTTKLVKLMKAYCDRQMVDYASVVFSYDGQRLREDQTPGEVRHMNCIFVRLICPHGDRLEHYFEAGLHRY